MAIGSTNPTNNLTKIKGVDVSVGAGNTDTGTQRVAIATNQTVIPVSDNGGSFTVDAPATTPVFVRLSSGTAAVDTIPVTGTFWQATQPVSIASLPSLTTGTNFIGNIGTVSTVTNLSQLGGNTISMGSGIRSTGTLRVTVATDDVVQVSQSGTWNINSITTLPALPTGSNAIGKLVANSGIDIGDVTLNNALNSGTVDANTIRVVDAGAANASVTSVTATTTTTSLKAANTSRVGLTIFNNSASVLYVKLGTTASATDFSIKMAASSYYEVPFGYNGAVTGIWVTTDGAALVTEIS
jgi:hypothetical protein